jgi:signal transduction histidine kinase
VMVLQVGAVRHRMPTASEEGDALRDVERVGRTALAEMRRLLGALRQGGEEPELTPHPGLDDLPTLAGDVRAAGLDVRLHREGEPVDLPRSLDLSAYRIVQEGLTNALTHANCAHADVTVRFAGDGVEVEIIDDGSAIDGSGRSEGESLAGMRERVALYGGTLETGPRAGGGYLVRAQLPVEAKA